MEDDIPQALAAMCMNEILDPNWYVNTDATAHMTSNSGNCLLLLFSLGKIKYLLLMMLAYNITYG